MRRLKRNRWKASIAIAGILLLLVLMMWVPIPMAGAYEGASGLATPVTGTVQATPTVDQTMTALQKEQLTQQVKQLQNWGLYWLYNGSTAFIAAFAAIAVASLGLYQWRGNRNQERQKEIAAQDKDLKDRQAERERRDEEQQRWLKNQEAERERRDEEQQRWLKNQETEREKRAEERFQAVVEGLGSERNEAKVGAAIMLRTFLRPDYEQFYTQTFNLAVANLRFPRTSPMPEEDPDALQAPPSQADPSTPLQLTTLSQALIMVFKEAFPLAQSQNKGGSQSLDATGIQLDNAYLVEASLKGVWMPVASLQQANLIGTDLSGANLTEVNLSGACLLYANLSEARLRKATLRGVDLGAANLTKARLEGAKLNDANLSGVPLKQSTIRLSGTNFTRRLIGRDDETPNATIKATDLSYANLSGADLSGADLSGADLSRADLSRAIGTTPEQLKKAKSLKGAIMPDRKMYHDSSGASFYGADLRKVNLSDIDLSYANLSYANLSYANLSYANLSYANLSGADLSGVLYLEDTRSLLHTNLHGVKGLTEEQLKACKAKGAIIDEAPTTSPPKSPISPAQEPPSQGSGEVICSLGHKNPAGSVFCDKCGEPLPSTSSPRSTVKLGPES